MIKPFVVISIFVVALFACSEVYAQCAPGIPGGGNPSCVPPNVFYNSLPPGAPPPPPPPQWKTQWGAIAAGGGGFGAVTQMSNRRKAEKEALARCRDSGGGAQCSVAVSYYDQCAAIAWGTNSQSGWARALTADASASSAVTACGRQGLNCKLYYVGCSYPVRVRR